MKSTRLKSLLTGAVVMVMMFACTVIAHAASGSVTFGSVSYSVEAGKEFNVGVYVRSVDTKVAAYTFSITYDADKIEYISGADAASEGILSFAGYPNSDNTKIWLTFKAKEAGTCNITVTNPYIGPTDSKYGDSLTISKASTSPITIKGTGSTTETTGSSSGSADLKSIWIEETGFYGFSASKTKYDITVNNDLDKVTVTAKAADSNASVTISDTNLKVGTNYVYIDVTGTDGTTKRYTIIVRRKKASTDTTTSTSPTNPTSSNQPSTKPTTPTSEQETTPSTSTPDIDLSVSLFSYNGVPLYFCEGFDGVTIPEGYTVTGVKIGDSYEANALVNESGTKILLCMAEGEGKKGKLYVYTSTSIFPYIELSNGEQTYVIDGSSEPTVPAGYEKVSMVIKNGVEDESIAAWYNSSAEGFYLIYASYNGGKSALYQYDTKENTIQRFNGMTAGTSTGTQEEGKTDSELQKEIEELKKQNKSEMKTWLVVVIILALLCVGLIVVVFLMFNRMREQQEYAGYDEENEEYYDDGDYDDISSPDNGRDSYNDDKKENEEDIDDNDFTFL